MLAVRTVGRSARSAVGLLYLFHVSLTCDADRNVTLEVAAAGRRLKWLQSMATDGQKLLLDATAATGDNPSAASESSLVNVSPGGAGVPVAVAILGTAFLVIASCAIHAHWSGKRLAQAWTSPLMVMLASPEAITFMIYVCLWTCLKFSLGAGKYINYSAMFLLAIVATGKLVLSVALYVYQDGTMREFAKLLVDKRKDVALYCVPAAMYSISDTLMILCLSRIDPLTYTLLINVRDVVITGLWSRMFGKTLSWMRYAAIVIMSAGMVAKEFKFRHDLGESASARFETYMMVLLGAIAGAIGSLWNEKMLRESCVTMNAQNAVMYSFSLVISLVVHGIYSYMGHDAPMLPSSGRGKDWALYCSIVLIFVLFGIAAAHFLKRLGNGARVGVNATMVIVTAPLQMIFFGYTFGSFEWLGIAVILAGMAVYARDLTDSK